MPNCQHCSKPACFKCARCSTMWYCTKACQTAHWPTHRQTCVKPSRSLTSTAPGNFTWSEMVDYYATKTPQEICNKLLEDPEYKARKDIINSRLTGQTVLELLLEANGKSNGQITDNGVVLLFQSLQALIRCLDKKQLEGDFITMQCISLDEMLTVWPNSEKLKTKDTDYLYVSVATQIPLSALRSDLKNITISHCLTTFLKHAPDAQFQKTS